MRTRSELAAETWMSLDSTWRNALSEWADDPIFERFNVLFHKIASDAQVHLLRVYISCHPRKES